MKFFVDTAEIDAIAELNDLGMVDGVTTNPSLIKKSGRDIIEVTKEICDLVDGPVSAEVTATEADAMIAEGRALAEIADTLELVSIRHSLERLKQFPFVREAIEQRGLELHGARFSIHDGILEWLGEDGAFGAV